MKSASVTVHYRTAHTCNTWLATMWLPEDVDEALEAVRKEFARVRRRSVRIDQISICW
jgi:hypothetical protein